MSCDTFPSPRGPVVVIGAGTMGHGIAHVSASAGFVTRLYDVDPAARASAMASIEANLDRGVELGKVEPEARNAALDLLSETGDSAEAATGADLVIEAVPEDLDLKQRVLSEFAAYVKPDAILGSNTSSLSISRIGDGVPGPERLVGLHFFNPVHIMALVEVVRGDRTAERVVESARSFVESLDKEAIIVNDSPGFASSRLGVAIGLEAIRMLESGVASAHDIDRAMELGYRHPMGPLRLTDLVGLDVRLRIARYLHAEIGERFRPPALLERLVEEGKLGRKTGQGFYSW
ncbi:MAG: 3-hydroxyacyl-CoA dehydrogenase family protein [Gemmatimonadetes bacterium]|nr:3-hydroxyacyl-CoA dehydrogenase family protein [Gemmatimonadota bacterium]NNK61909.1 3-hydroxyacyl-CoA dehydrogenase family protein [Gemmatimonadota bacterium]